MNLKSFHLLFNTFLVIIIFSNVALAVPGIPHQFYGTVTWNGNPAPDGTTVVAKINGIEVARTTTKDGKYGYDPIFYVDDPNNDRSGEEIRFFVNGVDTGQKKYFCNGCVTLLNLAVSTSPSPGGGGGGGGGFAPPTEEEIKREGEEVPTEGNCEERWVCSEWSECIDGRQTRTCEDVNNCGTERNIPLMVQPCTNVGIKKEIGKGETKEALLPTGFFLGLSTTEWAIGIIVGIIVAVIIIFTVSRGKEKIMFKLRKD